MVDGALGVMDLGDTPVWKIIKKGGGKYKPVLTAWYTNHDEAAFLTPKSFGTEKEAEDWLKEFWQTYWRLY